ncbi:enhancer of mRNA-decapping protein 3 [Bacillus rossius redtenbacheri]|uniref:enhancer of mRNA-decapping protein 3 n=1 Tax=Bacillus rossius redtenbacheri TaxID=93214 RepID=UPI002FDE066F
MPERWLGCVVSVDCGPVEGIYQGQIAKVDGKAQTITLKKVFQNGVPSSLPEVTLHASNITSLDIIHTAEDAAECKGQTASVVAITKPAVKRPGRSISESHAPSKGQQRESPRKGGDLEAGSRAAVSEAMRTPSKKDRNRQKLNERDEACFGTPIDNIPHQDFDFEKNLALFNKQAVYDEINASQRPDVVRHTDASRRQQKFRHDENVISSIPAACRQVIVPEPDVKEYVTDDGLVIPSVMPELRRHIMLVAERYGLSAERQTELMGRAATEMALQLLGGGHRLNPRNSHQWPTVVALCGPHRQGATGLNCARQLASHGVRTLVFLLDTACATQQLKQELELYRLTGNKLISKIADLPLGSVDLIVLALADDGGGGPGHALYHRAASWANDSRAPVLALDPPPAGTPGVDTKLSLLSFLPLAHAPHNGRLYLCNLACPQQVFEATGVKYASPFGPKFVIPLHLNT